VDFDGGGLRNEDIKRKIIFSLEIEKACYNAIIVIC
jgi:hypothetical protein